jgi:hypothetical protein
MVASGTRNARAISGVPSPPSSRRVSATWAGWFSAERPPGDRHGERVLDRFLGGVDVAEEADQDSDAAAVLPAEDSLDSHCGRA